jgi:GTP cyclohydrolase II
MTQVQFDNWCSLPTPMGEFRMYDAGSEDVHLVCFGDIHELGEQPLLRMHSSCLASEVFDAMDCDCADQLRESMKLIANKGRGLIIHLRQEGRGQGLSEKIRAVGIIQRRGLDTFEAFDALGLEQDPRRYDPALEILRALGIHAVRLISNNPRKARFLEERGVRVERVPTHPTIRPENLDYLRTKQRKLDHDFVLDSDERGSQDIRFYHSDQPHGELSNFSRHAIFLGGRIWPTSEHYYQAQKFAGTEREERIRCAPTPTLAKELARDWKRLRRQPWAEVKEQHMLAALRAKFTQHPDLQHRLLSTGNRRLVEHTEHDAYWGDGGDGRGRNRLGVLLMQVRDELRLASHRQVAG